MTANMQIIASKMDNLLSKNAEKIKILEEKLSENSDKTKKLEDNLAQDFEIDMETNMDSTENSQNVKKDVNDYIEILNLKKTSIKRNNEGFFKCHDCDYKTPHSHNFDAHVRMHKKEKPFKCKLCNRQFTQKISCIIHIRTHDDSLKLKCDVCDELFINEQTILRHATKAHDGLGYTRKKRIIKRTES